MNMFASMQQEAKKRFDDWFVVRQKVEELERTVNALTLHWSYAKPTVSGHYWLKDGTAQVITSVEIGLFDSCHYERIYFVGHDTPVNLCDVNGQWAGPIAPPEREPVEFP